MSIKNKFSSTFEFLYPLLFKAPILFFSLFNSIRRRPKILVFTDSRGFEVTKIWNRKNPFSSYIKKLIFSYNCTVKVCPEKFTSILDFLTFYETISHKKFKKVVLHCGIVDFAPRPESSFNLMYEAKVSKVKKYSIEKYISKRNRDFGTKYQGEKTLSFLNDDSITNVLLPLLQKIPNLVYIGVNPVLSDWIGNYWRKRPDNINEQLLLDELLITGIVESIDLSNLQREDIKCYTTDNVHYTKEGFDFIYAQLLPLLPKI